jgi:hypothetical protein
MLVQLCSTLPSCSPSKSALNGARREGGGGTFAFSRFSLPVASRYRFHRSLRVRQVVLCVQCHFNIPRIFLPHRPVPSTSLNPFLRFSPLASAEELRPHRRRVGTNHEAVRATWQTRLFPASSSGRENAGTSPFVSLLVSWLAQRWSCAPTTTPCLTRRLLPRTTRSSSGDSTSFFSSSPRPFSNFPFVVDSVASV